jgi:O-antigen/teichoic acid export membrane protein
LTWVRKTFADLLARVRTLRTGAVGRLTQGAILAQLIGLATSPISARIFGPAESGAAAVFITLLTIPIALASLRLDGAIALAATRSERSAVLHSALALLPLTALTSLLVFVGVRRPLAEWMDEPRIVEFVWIVPLVIIAIGTFQALSSWATREGLFEVLAGIPVRRSVQQLGFQLTGGLLTGGSAWILVSGHVIGGTGGSFRLWRAIQARVREDWSSRAAGDGVVKHLRRYREFVSYGALGTSLNYAGAGIPLVAMGLLHGAEGAGLYRWGQLLVWIPATAVVASVSSVYSAHFAATLHEAPSQLLSLRRNMTTRLIGLATVIGLGAVLLPFIVPVLLGARWAESGILALISFPAIAASIVTTPTCALPLLGRNAWQLWWEAVRLVLMGLAFVLCSRLKTDVQSTTVVFTVALAAGYVLHWVLNELALRRAIAASGQGI